MREMVERKSVFVAIFAVLATACGQASEPSVAHSRARHGARDRPRLRGDDLGDGGLARLPLARRRPQLARAGAHRRSRGGVPREGRRGRRRHPRRRRRLRGGAPGRATWPGGRSWPSRRRTTARAGSTGSIRSGRLWLSVRGGRPMGSAARGRAPVGLRRAVGGARRPVEGRRGLRRVRPGRALALVRLRRVLHAACREPGRHGRRDDDGRPSARPRRRRGRPRPLDERRQARFGAWPACKGVSAVAFDLRNYLVCYAAAGHTLLRSADGGVTWSIPQLTTSPQPVGHADGAHRCAVDAGVARRTAAGDLVTTDELVGEREARAAHLGAGAARL